MKTRFLSLVLVVTLSRIVYAGGDIPTIAEEEPVIIPVEAVDKSAFYIGAGYSVLDYNEVYNDGVTADVDMKGLTLLVGYKYNPYIAFEGRYTKDIGGSDEKWSDDKTRSDIENQLSNLALYFKPSYTFDNFNVYGLLGYGQLSYKYKSTEKQTENGFQWGLGVSYIFYDNLSVFVDYTKLYDDTGFDNYIADVDYDADAWLVGVMYTF